MSKHMPSVQFAVRDGVTASKAIECASTGDHATRPAPAAMTVAVATMLGGGCAVENADSSVVLPAHATKPNDASASDTLGDMLDCTASDIPRVPHTSGPAAWVVRRAGVTTAASCCV